MLILSRKQNESIVIDGQISIKVLSVKGNTIRLGISAPDEVKILRAELAPFGKEIGGGKEVARGKEIVSYEGNGSEESRPGFVAEISPEFVAGSVVAQAS